MIVATPDGRTRRRRKESTTDTLSIGDVAQLIRVSGQHATDTGSTSQCGKGFFSKSQFSEQALLWCPYSLRVQSHALLHVRTLKIPSTGSIILFGNTKVLQALAAVGSAAHVPAVALLDQIFLRTDKRTIEENFIKMHVSRQCPLTQYTSTVRREGNHCRV